MSLLKKIINYIIIMSRSRYSNFISQDEPENLSHEFEDVFNHMDENKRINDEINRRIDEEEKEKERLNFIKNNMQKEQKSENWDNKKVFFQNPDDSLLFVNKKIVRKEQVAQVNGSGVNLEKFPFSTPPSQPIFMTMARLLKSKGLINKRACVLKLVTNIK